MKYEVAAVKMGLYNLFLEDFTNIENKIGSFLEEKGYRYDVFRSEGLDYVSVVTFGNLSREDRWSLLLLPEVLGLKDILD